MYYRGAQVALLVFDLTIKSSFDGAKRWYHQLCHEIATEVMPVIVFIGNKKDLPERVIKTSVCYLFII